jgi:shikimate 5-dehydrogenase
VLGAGGAARAAVWALREAGAEVAVWNRTEKRAAELARELAVEHATRPRTADILVNATAVGLHGESDSELIEALPLAGLDFELVVDMPYGSGPTGLVAWARGRGARVVDGLELLVRQGARSFERWTAQPAPLEAMRRGAADEGV